MLTANQIYFYMHIASQLLEQTDHRPWPLPKRPWVHYQEWKNVVFLHWEIPKEILEALIPREVQLDTFENKAYVSLVPFTMKNTRIRYLPSNSLVSDFHEINLRTYIKKDNKAGVYFINMEAGKWISALLARVMTGFPYRYSRINRTAETYQASNKHIYTHLDLKYKVQEQILKKSDLDRWLTERYCVYLTIHDALCYHEVHHQPWPLNRIEISELDLFYQFGKFRIDNKPTIAHYSPGINVIAWNREIIKTSSL